MYLYSNNSEKTRYEMRNEIETIVKEQHINRAEFHEVAKDSYAEVIRRVYYSFCNYEKYPTIQLPYMWTRFRKGLEQSPQIPVDWANWDLYLNYLDDFVLGDSILIFYYLIVDGGWVYEGTLREIKKVLYEEPRLVEDFYITPRNYEWLIVHCGDGECMFKLSQKTSKYEV